MKRFVNIGGQIIEGEKQFSFYCTVTDKFEIFGGNQVWSSKENFISDMIEEQLDDQDRHRLSRLIPEDWDKMDLVLSVSKVVSKPGEFTVYDASKGHCPLCGSISCSGTCFK